MGYLHINNLYRDTRILDFRRCYALEKVHGTSAHVRFTSDKRLEFFSGGEKHERFVELFDQADLAARFDATGAPCCVVYGEAYGGKQQGQSKRYGKELRFVAFDVCIDGLWLDVPKAAQLVTDLGLRFVDFAIIATEMVAIDAERDKPTTEGQRNGVEGDHPREGVVLRPPFEVRTNNGERIIAKHKRDEERETKTPRVVNGDTQAVLVAAQAIADEWVTPMRLTHVLQQFGAEPAGIERTGDVIKAMVADVVREAGEEIVDSREARAAIGKACATMFKRRLQSALRESGAA